MQLINIEVDRERIRPHLGIIDYPESWSVALLEDQLWMVEVKQLDDTNDTSVTRGIFLEKSPQYWTAS